MPVGSQEGFQRSRSADFGREWPALSLNSEWERAHSEVAVMEHRAGVEFMAPLVAAESMVLPAAEAMGPMAEEDSQGAGSPVASPRFRALTMWHREA